MKQQRDLAAKGHPFVSVKASEDALARRAGRIMAGHRADRAQKFGTFIIEELIEPGSGQPQVRESPDSGTDPQTRSGAEGQRGSRIV
ncbi:MAG: hypothetical protein ABW032_09625 [Burkholderiaceae bacterium]